MKQSIYSFSFLILCFWLLSFQQQLSAQGLYTARGYWEESNKETYRIIKQKQLLGAEMSMEEWSYLKDYEEYLDNYFSRLPEAEKEKYFRMKDEWDSTIVERRTSFLDLEDFEWRGRDRAINIGFGLAYGSFLVAIVEPESPAAIGIPLITGGLWALGPLINPKKYEGIDRSVVRASNFGKSLGLLYGGSLGVLLAGESNDAGKWILGLATAGSIGLGEVAYQVQKKQRFPEGQVDFTSHYTGVGSWVAFSSVNAFRTRSPRVIGASILAGGAGGFLLSRTAYQNYNYTRGDVDQISSLSLIGTGVGLTFVIGALENGSGGNGLWLVPAGGTVLGTLISQKMVQGVNLTVKQGSTIGFSTLGASLVGLGFAALFQVESATALVAFPTVFSLVTNQILFSKFKRDNLKAQFSSNLYKDNWPKLTIKTNPENILINKMATNPFPALNPFNAGINPVFNVNLTF